MADILLAKNCTCVTNRTLPLYMPVGVNGWECKSLGAGTYVGDVVIISRIVANQRQSFKDGRPYMIYNGGYFEIFSRLSVTTNQRGEVLMT